MSVSIRVRLPRNEFDGLQAVADRYRDGDAKGELCIIVIEAYLDRMIVHLHDDSDPVDYVLAVRHVETLTDPAEESFARAALSTRYEQRTGKATLPFGTIYDAATDPDDD